MTSQLRHLFDAIIAEAERRPEFGRRLVAAIGHAAPPPAKEAESAKPKSRSRNRRAPGVLDPFEVFTHGEQELRRALVPLNIDQLKDIVSEHAMDSAKLALKWKSSERLIDLVVTTVRTRVEKGDGFKRDFVTQRSGGDSGSGA